jgi:hypothetical protein
MPNKFINYVLFPVTTVALLGTIIRNQARPSKAHTQTLNQWKKTNDGLGVNDVGRR